MVKFSSQLSNFLVKLNHNVISNISDTFLIVGDFNMSGIKWLSSDNNHSRVSRPSNLKSSDEYLFIDELFTLNLDQYNSVINKQGRILDLVLSNNSVNVVECLDPLVPIDTFHPALLINMDFAEITALDYAPRLKYSYDKGDYDSINDEVSKIDWELEFSGRSIDESVDFFNKTISNLQATYIPRKFNRNKSFPVWYSAALVLGKI